MLAKKSVKQSYHPSAETYSLMLAFRDITNDAIGIGLRHGGTSNMKRLCNLAYTDLKSYKIYSKYKLCAISKAAGILASRKKSINRGCETKNPYVKKPLLVSCYGFKIVNGKLKIPIGKRKYESIPLYSHTLKILSDRALRVRSFTLSETTLSLCVAKEVTEMIGTSTTIGIDRNLRNLTVGNSVKVLYYDTKSLSQIGETTREIVGSFKRNDFRIRRQLSSKYGKRKKDRVRSILNKISKEVVEQAKENCQGIVFEDIRYIRSMYRRGNGQGNNRRRQMNNNWPFAEIKRQIEYKAQWAGVPVIHLTKSETRGTSLECVKCGERLQSPFKNDDVQHKRQLWCKKCEKWFDRDLVAVMNISRRGWVRFAHSKGIGSEAMVQEPEETTVILKVDPMKLPAKM